MDAKEKHTTVLDIENNYILTKIMSIYSYESE